MPDNKHKKAATVSDIAKKAGTSIATVSRVLSNSGYPVNIEMSKNIRRIAKELNYTPNLLGRMLKNNSNPAIGVIIPTLQNPFFNQVLTGVEAEARRRNYEALIYSSHRDKLLERKLISSLMEKRVMGIIIISIDDSPASLEKYMLSGGKAAVLEANFSIANTIKAYTDFVSSGRMAVEHLLSMGHRRIAFLAAPLTKQSRLQVLNGCRLVLAENQILMSDNDIIVAKSEIELSEGMYEFEEGRQLVKELLPQLDKYTAIIAANDLMAFGIIQELNQNGIYVPENISIIGFDNIPFSAMITPPLTTINQPSTIMGQTMCKLMIDSMESDNAVNDITVSFQPNLIVRQSVKDLNQ